MPTGTVVVIAAHASVWWSEEESNIRKQKSIYSKRIQLPLHNVHTSRYTLLILFIEDCIWYRVHVKKRLNNKKYSKLTIRSEYFILQFTDVNLIDSKLLPLKLGQLIHFTYIQRRALFNLPTISPNWNSIGWPLFHKVELSLALVSLYPIQ